MRPDVHYTRSGGASLAYQVVGEGPTDMLLVSGYLSNVEYAWQYPSMAAFLSRLASFSRLILMDRRGSGLSDRFTDAPPIESTLQDMEAVLDEVGSPKTTLFGVWDGCMDSVLFAASRPERVSGLVLFSSSPAQVTKEDFPWAWDEDTWRDWLGTIRDRWGTRAWVVRNARWMGPSMFDDPAELDHWISYTRLSASPASAEAVMRNTRDTDVREILPLVQAPTLVLHRTGDQVEDVEAGRYVASKIPEARFVELPGHDGIPWIGDAESVLSEIQSFLGRGPGPAINADRRLSTVLFTDIVGSTEQAAALGDAGWRGRLTDHERICRKAIDRYGGRLIDSAGDGVFADFDGPAAAVRCGRAIAEDLRAIDIEIRAGAHTGEVELAGDKVSGIAVHIGARICALAQAGELMVSSTVKDLSAGSGLIFEDAGAHELKGVPDRWHLYRLVGETERRSG